MEVGCLFGGLGLTQFGETVWGRRSFVARGAFNPADAFSLEELSGILRRSALLRGEHVRASGVRPEDPVNSQEEQQHLQEPMEVASSVEAGLGISLNRLERFLPEAHPLLELYRKLSRICGCSRDAIQIACFLTPPGGQNFARHRDRDHVFTLQLMGEKTWEIGHEDALETVQIAPGDVLYVPYGLPHRVLAGVRTSLSIAFILRPLTYRDLVVEAVMQLLDRSGQEELSTPFPLPLSWLTRGEVPADMTDTVRALLAAARLERLDLAHALDALAVQTLPTVEEPSWKLPLSLGLQGLGLETLLERNGDNTLRVWTDGLRVVAAMAGRPQLHAPAELALALDFVDGARGSFRVGDLPSLYDDDTKVVIARKLISAGFVQRLPERA